MALMDRHPITPPPAAAPPHPAPARPIRQPRLEAIEGGAAARPRPAAPFSLKRWLESGIGGAVLGCLSIATVLLAWYLATRYKVEFYVRFGNIPTPADVWRSILDVTHSTKYAVNIGISVRRVLIGFCGAAVVGTVLGVMVGRYRIFRSLALPAMELFRPIPAIAWVPMAIMLWPNNEVSISFITFLGAFFPILLNTVHGVESVDGVLLRAAHSLGAKEKDVILYVVIPGALPHIFTGLAVGMGVAWVSLIAAEMISGQFGIGYFTWEAYSLISYPDIALGMITIGVLGLLCSKAIDQCSKLAMPWMALVAGAAK